MSQKNNSNYSNRGGGGPQNGKGNMFRRNGPGKFNGRSNQSQIGERHGGGSRKDSAGKLAARSDLATLTYCEKGSSNLLTNLKEIHWRTTHYLWQRIRNFIWIRKNRKVPWILGTRTHHPRTGRWNRNNFDSREHRRSEHRWGSQTRTLRGYWSNSSQSN